MTYQIEDNIPLPESRAGRQLRPETAMFRKMTHGQSFFIETNTVPRNIYNCLAMDAKRDGRFKVVMRKQAGGWRLWKMEIKGRG